MDDLLISVSDFTHLLTNCYADAHKAAENEEEEEGMEVLCYITRQLLSIVPCLDLQDEAGRRVLSTFLREMLSGSFAAAPSELVDGDLLKNAMTALGSLNSNQHHLLGVVTEIVEDIVNPVQQVEPVPQANDEEQRAMAMKIARIHVKLQEYRDEMAACVREEKFEDAALVKEVGNETTARGRWLNGFTTENYGTAS